LNDFSSNYRQFTGKNKPPILEIYEVYLHKQQLMTL